MNKVIIYIDGAHSCILDLYCGKQLNSVEG